MESRSRPVVFFNDSRVLVTDRFIRVADQQFPIGELTNLRTVRAPRDPVAVTTAIVGAVILVAVVTTMALLRNTASVTIGLPLTVLVVVVMVIAARRIRPPAYELLAEFRGVVVTLFTTTDAIRYGQLTRALIRARERAHTVDDLAGESRRASEGGLL